MNIDFSDDIEGSIAFLHCLDETYSGAVRDMRRNLQLDSVRVDRDVAESLIHSDSILPSNLHKQHLFEYLVFMSLDARGSVPDVPLGLDCRLDGLAWQEP